MMQGTAGSDGVAQGAGTAVDVDLVVRHVQLGHQGPWAPRQRLRSLPHRSTSATLQPALARAFSVAPRGGGKPLGFLCVVAWLTMRASGVQPSLGGGTGFHHHQGGCAVVDAGAAGGGDGAVFLKAGFRVGSLSSLILPGPSSMLTTLSPVRPLTVTGVISAANAPLSVAAWPAAHALAVAKASCCSRVKLYLAAQSSPKVPMLRRLVNVFQAVQHHVVEDAVMADAVATACLGQQVGALVMLSMPPATSASWLPASSMSCANMAVRNAGAAISA